MSYRMSRETAQAECLSPIAMFLCDGIPNNTGVYTENENRPSNDKYISTYSLHPTHTFYFTPLYYIVLLYVCITQVHVRQLCPITRHAHSTHTVLDIRICPAMPYTLFLQTKCVDFNCCQTSALDSMEIIKYVIWKML